ncbi:hypothetical protein GORHZ_213_00260 [Gordonia rhizosphera NBRC 16068]|uniref:Uncharacterized protein n=1 Tax=Gordonia rhizosphera NBRC 16068 TaxID=1108045 RepID=K6WHJ8_9ACTN|nr:hypothetical protein GORHZ_213_00260 [Gordonia rhizosphera NBRC 16068]
MAFYGSQYDPAAPRSVYQSIADDTTEIYLTEQTVVFLTTGFDRMAEREFCVACPAELLCAAAEGELNRLAPNTCRDVAPSRRRLAVQTLNGMSISTVDRPEGEDICFGRVVNAIEREYLFEAASTPNVTDPLDPATRRLFWLADRVRAFTRDVAGRLASGQHL